MGVRAAMKKAEGAADRAGQHENVTTYGPLIHNAQAINKLAARGVGQVNTPDEVDGGTVVIRAHGVPQEIYEKLRDRGAAIVDGTCPRVLHSMRVIERYCQEGCHVILVGDADHGEVQAVASYSDDVTVVENREQAAHIEVPDESLVIAQTTVSQREYDAVCKVLLKKNNNITIVQSICPATQERQTALKKLAREVEAILVIGGKHSSNTKRLYDLAVETGKPAWHIESCEEIPEEVSGFDSIGITAGASTPDWVIDEVEIIIKEM